MAGPEIYANSTRTSANSQNREAENFTAIRNAINELIIRAIEAPPGTTVTVKVRGVSPDATSLNNMSGSMKSILEAHANNVKAITLVTAADGVYLRSVGVGPTPVASQTVVTTHLTSEMGAIPIGNLVDLKKIDYKQIKTMHDPKEVGQYLDKITDFYSAGFNSIDPAQQGAVRDAIISTLMEVSRSQRTVGQASITIMEIGEGEHKEEHIIPTPLEEQANVRVNPRTAAAKKVKTVKGPETAASTVLEVHLVEQPPVVSLVKGERERVYKLTLNQYVPFAMGTREALSAGNAAVLAEKFVSENFETLKKLGVIASIGGELHLSRDIVVIVTVEDRGMESQKGTNAMLSQTYSTAIVNALSNPDQTVKRAKVKVVKTGGQVIPAVADIWTDKTSRTEFVNAYRNLGPAGLTDMQTELKAFVVANDSLKGRIDAAPDRETLLGILDTDISSFNFPASVRKPGGLDTDVEKAFSTMRKHNVQLSVNMTLDPATKTISVTGAPHLVENANVEAVRHGLTPDEKLDRSEGGFRLSGEPYAFHMTPEGETTPFVARKEDGTPYAIPLPPGSIGNTRNADGTETKTFEFKGGLGCDILVTTSMGTGRVVLGHLSEVHNRIPGHLLLDPKKPLSAGDLAQEVQPRITGGNAAWNRNRLAATLKEAGLTTPVDPGTIREIMLAVEFGSPHVEISSSILKTLGVAGIYNKKGELNREAYTALRTAILEKIEKTGNNTPFVRDLVQCIINDYEQYNGQGSVSDKLEQEIKRNPIGALDYLVYGVENAKTDYREQMDALKAGKPTKADGTEFNAAVKQLFKDATKAAKDYTDAINSGLLK